jgi:putative hydrolase of HD superfamily
MLPDDQAALMTNLWQEYTDRETAEAKFAASLDHLMPLLHNFHTGGKSWAEHGIHADQVLSRNQLISEGSSYLWDFAQSMIDEFFQEGLLAPSEDLIS